MTYIAPEYISEKFTCPHCQAIAHQHWNHAQISKNGYFSANFALYCYANISKCAHCEKWCFWFDGKMIFPANVASVPPSHQDMPEQCQGLYDEAKNIFNQSPRAAAALLRLCTERLVQVLTGKEKINLNQGIKELVKFGLPMQIQKALDICRITGNDAVHPNEIGDDNAEIAGQLFALLNIIVDNQITQPKELESFAQKVITPEKQKAIDKRDK
jgi:hypothetical protein